MTVLRWRERFESDDRLELRQLVLDAAISGAEATLDATFPGELRELYRVSDGVFNRPGQWFVVWPLAHVVDRNMFDWSEAGVRDADRLTLLGFGDDGTGAAFCVPRDGARACSSGLRSTARPFGLPTLSVSSGVDRRLTRCRSTEASVVFSWRACVGCLSCWCGAGRTRAGLEDVGVERDAVDDRGDVTWIEEHGAPFAERQVGGDADGGAFLAFSYDLEEQLGSARVNLDVAQLIEQQKIETAVASDNTGDSCRSSAASTSSLTSCAVVT